MGRNLALEAVRVTEAAALAAYSHMGQGDEEAADRAAVEAMADTLSTLPLNGQVCIGEGKEGEVENLYVGQKIGTGDGPHVDVALMPLEGTSIIARGGFNAISALALSESNGFLSVPSIYMDKIAVGSGLPADIVDLAAPPEDNLPRVAIAKGLAISDLVICMLDRPRHKDLIESVRATGARLRLIMDGDVSGAVAPVRGDSGIDVYMGTGLAPQGVLAAAALRCAGGQMQARLVLRNKDDQHMVTQAGIEDAKRIYTIDDMTPGDVTFAATGITTGPLLDGIARSPYSGDGYTFISHSMVLRSSTGTWRFIETHHHNNS
jgi:fructose-1,6-bisphosphatase II / sedoheptulose-1,7-bisphosphatase